LISSWREDLTDLLVALGDAAREHDSGVVFLIDEVHFLTTIELEALIAALHKTVQRQLPITLVGAGLPQLPRLAGEAKSYAERLFKFPQIGELSAAEAKQALVDPAERLDTAYDEGAQQARDVAALLGRTSEQMGPTRSGLIDKGLLYTPGHGLAAFTVPQFDRFMRRTYPLQ